MCPDLRADEEKVGHVGQGEDQQQGTRTRDYPHGASRIVTYELRPKRIHANIQAIPRRISGCPLGCSESRNPSSDVFKGVPAGELTQDGIGGPGHLAAFRERNRLTGDPKRIVTNEPITLSEYSYNDVGNPVDPDGRSNGFLSPSVSIPPKRVAKDRHPGRPRLRILRPEGPTQLRNEPQELKKTR